MPWTLRFRLRRGTLFFDERLLLFTLLLPLVFKFATLRDSCIRLRYDIRLSTGTSVGAIVALQLLPALVPPKRCYFVLRWEGWMLDDWLPWSSAVVDIAASPP